MLRGGPSSSSSSGHNFQGHGASETNFDLRTQWGTV